MGRKTRTSNYYYESDDNPWVRTTKSYEDQVSGYTIRQLEDAIRTETRWGGWKTNIKDLYENTTENHLDTAFDYWVD